MWRTFKEAISFAIQKEAGSVALYEAASSMAKNPDTKAMFDELSAEERRHREMLENLKKEDISEYTLEKAPDMKISDYLHDVEFHPEMSYQDILILAMKREDRAKNLYTEFANMIEDLEVKRLFQTLAQQEARHKLRLETEYEKYVLADN